MLKANKELGAIQLDSETQLTGVPREAIVEAMRRLPEAERTPASKMRHLAQGCATPEH